MAMEFFGSEEKNFNSKILDSLNKSKKVKKVILAFLKVFEKKNQIQGRLRISQIIFTVTEISLFLQFSSILWRETMPFDNWASFIEFWRILSYFRVDQILSELGLSMFTYYFFSAFIYDMFFQSIYLIYCSFKKMDTWAVIIWLINRKMYFESSMLLYPMSIFFFSYFLDSFGLFQGKSAGFFENYHNLQAINCGICLIFHISISIFAKLLVCEVAHGTCETAIESKSSSSIDLKSLGIDFFLIAIHCILPDNRIQIIHILACISKIWLCIYTCIYLPYYNPLSNKIFLARIFCETILALLFGCNYFIGQSSFLFFSSIFLIPLSVFIAFHIIDLRYNLITKKTDTLNVSLFELANRKDLMVKEFKSPLAIEKFNELIKKEKFISGNIENVYIWLSYYCIFTLKDFRLAYIKLSPANKKTTSIETYIQVLKLRNFLKVNYLNELEDLCFLDYILKLNQTKNLDKDICELYLEFSGEITGKKPSKAKLKKFSKILEIKLHRTAKSYKKICEKYPNGIEAHRLFRSFCEDIYSTSNKNLTLKVINEVKNNEIYEISYFDDKNGILIVSGESADLGKITYSNDRFAMMLRTSVQTLIGSELNSIIPYPYNIGHNSTLIRYAKYCTNSRLRFPGSLFLKTEKNYLVEFHFKISCVSLTNSVFYLVVAKEIENEQIIVLLSPSGLIYSHSEDFHNLVLEDGTYFENYFIQDLIPGLNLENMEINKPESLTLNCTVWYIVKSFRKISFVEMSVLFIVKSYKALDEILRQNFREKKLENENQHSEKSMPFTKNAETQQVRFEDNNKDDKSEKIEKSIDEEFKETNKDDKNSQIILKMRGLDELKNILKICLKKLKLVKVLIFVFSLLIILTCIANVVYIKELKNFSQENKERELFLEYIDDLVKSSKAVSYVNLNFSTIENIQTLNELSVKLKELNLKLADSVGDYKSCPSFPSSFKENTLFFYENDENYYENKINLFDSIQKFQHYIELFLQKYNNKTSTSAESKIILSNGLYNLYNQAVRELSEIDKCHNFILNNFEKIEKYILIIQLSLLSIFLGLINWQISSFIKGTNLVWKKISQNAYSSFFSIKSKCCERLTIQLQAQEEDVQAYYDLCRINHNEFSIAYSQIGGYCWRFSLIFALTGLYLVVFYAVFLENLKFISFEKNDIISSIYFRKFYLERIENFSLVRKANHGYSKTMIDRCRDEYYVVEKKEIFRDFGGIIKGKNYEYIYNYKDGESFLRFGMNNAANLLFIDSYDLTELTGNKTWVEFYEKGVKTYDLFDFVLRKVVLSGNSRIQELYLNTITGVIFYFVLCFLLYFLFYFPYLRKKGNTILSFQCIFHLFLSVEIDKFTATNTRQKC